ncbi:MAG: hypothetical protein V1495_04000 [Pseudomonadota bacterium]
MYKATLDRVAQIFSAEPYLGEFSIAREDYFRRTGKVFQDEPMFEIRMTACLEWYLLDRLLWDTGIPPIRLYRLKYRETLEERENEILVGLEKSIHSLFRVTGQGESRYVVEDLRTLESHEVSAQHPLAGVHRGDLLDARILELGDDRFFTDALWIHPSDAAPFITEEARKSREKGLETWETILMGLAYMKLKRERFSHVPTDQVYDWGMFERDRFETERRTVDAAGGG